MESNCVHSLISVTSVHRSMPLTRTFEIHEVCLDEGFLVDFIIGQVVDWRHSGWCMIGGVILVEQFFQLLPLEGLLFGAFNVMREFNEGKGGTLTLLTEVRVLRIQPEYVCHIEV